jgi:hypothetical protein
VSGARQRRVPGSLEDSGGGQLVSAARQRRVPGSLEDSGGGQLVSARVQGGRRALPESWRIQSI